MNLEQLINALSEAKVEIEKNGQSAVDTEIDVRVLFEELKEVNLVCDFANGKKYKIVLSR